MASDGDINVGSNTEITVGIQTRDQLQVGIDQAVLPVESLVDNDAIGQQDHDSGIQEETRSAVKVVTIMSLH